MAQIRAEIEINATPDDVRAVILDFPRYPEWHKNFLHSIATIPPAKDPTKLQPGEPLAIKVNGASVTPVVVTNTATEFSWRGSAYGGAFTGTHYFRYIESHVTPGGTTFVHGEDYGGWMSWMFGEGVCGIARGKVERLFEGFAHDVRARAEEVARLKKGIEETQGDGYAKI